MKSEWPDNKRLCWDRLICFDHVQSSQIVVFFSAFSVYFLSLCAFHLIVISLAHIVWHPVSVSVLHIFGSFWWLVIRRLSFTTDDSSGWLVTTASEWSWSPVFIWCLDYCSLLAPVEISASELQGTHNSHAWPSLSLSSVSTACQHLACCWASFATTFKAVK